MKKLISILAIMSVSLLSACSGVTPPADSGQKTETTTNTNAEQKPQAGAKKMIYALDGEVEEFDPGLNYYNRSSTLIQNMFRGLFKISADGKPVEAMAESYTVNEDNTKFTFKLKEGLKWSDGKPITAKDFEYSWKRVLNPEVASKAAADLFVIKNGNAYFDGKAKAEDVAVKVIDDLNFEVELEGPTPYFLYLLCAGSYYPVPQHVVESNSKWATDPSTYVVSGPFMMKEMRIGDRYIMVKNPNYFAADNVKLDELEMVILESVDARVIAFNNNEVYMADKLTASAVAQFKDSPELTYGDKINTTYFDLNTEHEHLKDPRVRQAISFAIDREAIIKNIVRVDKIPAYGMIPPGIPAPNDSSKDFRDVSGVLYKFDVEKAKQLLADAGYKDGQGFPKLTLIAQNDPEKTDIVQAISAMLKQNLNIDCEIKTFESKSYWDEIHQGNYDIGMDGWTGDYPDPITMYNPLSWPSQQTQTRWKNDKFVQNLDESRKTGDQAKRQELFLDNEKILFEDMPIIPFYFDRIPTVTKPNVKGVYRNFIGHVFFEDATIE